MVYGDNKTLFKGAASEQESMRDLEKEKPINFENIKDSCLFELKRFIDERGSMNPETKEVFIPPQTVSNEEETTRQMTIIDALSRNLMETSSPEEMHHLLQEQLTASPPEVNTVIGKCLRMTMMLDDNGTHFAPR
jgi:hypothetical protein